MTDQPNNQVPPGDPYAVPQPPAYPPAPPAPYASVPEPPAPPAYPPAPPTPYASVPQPPAPPTPYAQVPQPPTPQAYPPAPAAYPPADPYSQVPTPPQSAGPYGQPPFGQASYPEPSNYPSAVPAGPSAWGFPLASWGKRVGATLLDGVLSGVPTMVFYVIGMVLVAADSQTSGALSVVGGLIMVVGYLIGIALMLWNVCYKQGTTGMSFGKSIMRLRLVSEQAGQPIGFGSAFVRSLAHAIDGAICYIGFLFPLWDAKRQTIADKIMNTLVLDVTNDPNAGKFEWKL